MAAIYQTAVEIGLVSLLRQHIPGERFGVPRWLYFLLPIINRLQHATSKQRMGAWAETTILPDLLDFDPKRLSSKTFWYVTDDVISEKELRERRRTQPELTEDLFVGLDDSVFRTIEEELIRTLQSHYDLSEEILCYDTTNFFTYIEEPVRAHLAKTGHNKDCHHHCKQVGLALCVDKEWGIPLFHGVYQGNAHDSKTFAGLVEDLLTRLRIAFRQIKNLVLVLDKGNNSPENFAALQGKLHWVGSLVPSHYPDLLQLPLQNYTGQADTVRYYRCQRTVFGVHCVLVLTYNPKLAKKQEHKLRNGMEKLKRKLVEKWDAYKRKPKRVPAGITRLLEDSRYGKYLDVAYENGALRFSETEKVASQRQRFGKNLLFCSNPEAESSWIITQYRSKNRVEQDFHVLKDPELIRWRPARHWTDTKIRPSDFVVSWRCF